MYNRADHYNVLLKNVTIYIYMQQFHTQQLMYMHVVVYSSNNIIIRNLPIMNNYLLGLAVHITPWHEFFLCNYNPKWKIFWVSEIPQFL
jgi:hypothetical protein